MLLLMMQNLNRILEVRRRVNPSYLHLAIKNNLDVSVADSSVLLLIVHLFECDEQSLLPLRRVPKWLNEPCSSRDVESPNFRA